MQDTKEIVSTKIFKTVMILFGSLLLILITFAAGIHVGERKARYSYQWGANYERNFMGLKKGDERGPDRMMIFDGSREMMRDLQGGEMRNPHGLAGEIVFVGGNNIIVKDHSGKENTITIAENTLIKNGRDNIKISELKMQQRIVILGKPGDDGTVNANLIRVFPDKSSNN